MKALFLAIALAASLTATPAGAGWPAPGEHYAQASKGRDGNARQERGRESREARPDRRPEREERRERLNDDERRALHRDLDKANRELYQRRSQ
ncbi:MAG TPA: hypothetical protein VD867_05185 [Burkholderiales bacterium]|nr:hypothetical protein [Burkholderiales bacterium]